jgi:hypothetical protein
MSFTADPTVGSFTNWPTGSGGPFTMVVDQGLPSVEKIEILTFDHGTGLFTVNTGGRGFDGTTPTAHVVQSTVPQIQLCWTATEAMEANILVHAIMGTSPTNGQLIAWDSVSGLPVWTNGVAGVTGVPAGRIYQTVTTAIPNSFSFTPITGMVQDFVNGGVTTNVSGTGEIIVPTTGIYQVSASCAIDFTGGATVNTNSGVDVGTVIFVNGTAVRVSRPFIPGFAGSSGHLIINGIMAQPVSDIMQLNATDVVSLGGFQTSGASKNTYVAPDVTFLSLAMVAA